MQKFRITLNHQWMGDVEIEDVYATDPKAEAFRRGLIQRSDIWHCHAWPYPKEKRNDETDP